MAEYRLKPGKVGQKVINEYKKVEEKFTDTFLEKDENSRYCCIGSLWSASSWHRNVLFHGIWKDGGRCNYRACWYRGIINADSTDKRAKVKKEYQAMEALQQDKE